MTTTVRPPLRADPAAPAKPADPAKPATPAEPEQAQVHPPAPAIRSGTARRWPGGRDSWLVGAVVTLVLTVQAWNITGFPTASDDEGTYLAQAWAVRHGVGLAHYTYWYDHPPLGWIQLAGLSWLPEWLLPGSLAVGAGRLAMLPITAVTMVLVYVLCRRLGVARWAAALAVAVAGLSPLAVTMQRQLYLDSFAVMWMLAAFVLARSPRRHLWHFMGAGAAAGVSVLSKETMLLVVPAVVVALWQATATTAVRAYALASFTSGLVLVGAFYPLYALLQGELAPGADHVSLISALRFQLQQRPGSGWIFSDGTGSNALLHSWLFYDPVILIGGLLATVVALAVRRLRAPAVAAALLSLMAMRPGGYLPAMFVIGVLPFFAIVIAGVVELAATAILRHGPPSVGARPRLAVLAALTTLAVAIVGPQWYVGDRRAMVSADNAGYAQAAGWMRSQLPDRANTTVVVDDVLWLDLVGAGYTPDHVIWFYKLDLDPAVAKRLPAGWRDVDYLVSTPALRQDPNSLPTVRTLMSHSTTVASFGDGDGRIEIRRITKE